VAEQAKSDEGPSCPNDGSPKQPSKCPCEKQQQPSATQPSADSSVELTQSLRLSDSLPTLDNFSAVCIASTDSTVSAWPDPVPSPSGRALLAVYSLLRC
jgi:hypothetical protein